MKTNKRKVLNLTPYQEFIHKSRYAKWVPGESRREDWPETVRRYIESIKDKVGDNKGALSAVDLAEKAIINLDVMPSMRAMMTAGPALERCNVGGYNCAYLPVDSLRSFDEMMYVLMSGTGVGFSVEKAYVDKLPVISEHFETSNTVLVVEDSRSGWCRSFKELLSLLVSGQIPTWDVSKVRPKGAPLKTMGGRASGPEPLVDLFKYSINLFTNARGRKLKPIECHDLCCKVADVVVVGGVRRSALISLSDLNDKEMAEAKSGNWWQHAPWRANANNSAVYNTKPSASEFLKEWTDLIDSNSGERGIFNREACKSQVARNGRRDPAYEFGTNPCSEIILRPFQFCNLTEVVVRAEDTFETLTEKVQIASFLGTVQSLFTDFKYLRKVWEKTTEEERLLGVSLTGIYDNPLLIIDQFTLEHLRNEVVEVNKFWAKEFGIPQSTATTCVKPSGTVSQLVDSASGIHPRRSEFYIRRVRQDNKDPVTQFLKDSGVQWEPDITKPDTTTVFSFPFKAPEGAITREGFSALLHLCDWFDFQWFWCEHKPSATVDVEPDEWVKVASFVYDNWDTMTGVAFLPGSGNHTYLQAPEETITEGQYNELLAKTPTSLNWALLSLYEVEDRTVASQTLACVGGACEFDPPKTA